MRLESFTRMDDALLVDVSESGRVFPLLDCLVLSRFDCNVICTDAARKNSNCCTSEYQQLKLKDQPGSTIAERLSHDLRRNAMYGDQPPLPNKVQYHVLMLCTFAVHEHDI